MQFKPWKIKHVKIGENRKEMVPWQKLSGKYSSFPGFFEKLIMIEWMNEWMNEWNVNKNRYLNN